jgi:uncharacterized membrane protein YkvA (DUF1232 family)
MRFFRMLGALRATLPRILPLMRDSRVPLWLKAGTVAGAAFIVSPLDLLGDIPVIGIVDDVALMSLLAMLFVNLASAQAVRRGAEPEPELKVVHPL